VRPFIKRFEVQLELEVILHLQWTRPKWVLFLKPILNSKYYPQSEFGTSLLERSFGIFHEGFDRSSVKFSAKGFHKKLGKLNPKSSNGLAIEFRGFFFSWVLRILEVYSV
jgi:hypothetical protein